MYRMYLAMKERSPEDITAEDIAIASGKTVLDPAAMMDWFAKYETTTSTIETAFRRQQDAAAGPWEQDRFEDILAKWIVATDQPFSTVDDPEFRDLLGYVHHPSPSLTIPHRDAVKRRIMKMCEDTITATKLMFKVRMLFHTLSNFISHNCVAARCRRENQHLPRRMDIEQQLCLHGNRCPLHNKNRGTTRITNRLSRDGWRALRCKYG